MRIGFDNVDVSSSTGPNAFARRLAKALASLGHVVDVECQSCDVVLAFIERRRSTNDRTKIVQRLDGIWFAPEEFYVRNAGIKALYASCDRVVWQSQFDKRMTEKWWGLRQGAVIHNGVEEPPSTTKVPVKWGNDVVDTVFVSCANWHPQKRLKDNVGLFDHVHRTQCPNSCLFVIGEPDRQIGHRRVKYVGNLHEHERNRLLSAADWFIHLAWLDHCPNAVVEALSMGCQVIASDSGGTHELLDPQRDVIIKERQTYDFRLTKYDQPPHIDVAQVPTLSTVPRTCRAPSILDVARQYVKVFEEIA